MANIHDRDVNLAVRQDAGNQADPNAVVRQQNQALRTNFKISRCAIRTFIWTGIFMVIAANSLAFVLNFFLRNSMRCTRLLSINNYIFTAMLTFTFLSGFNEYFLLALFLKDKVRPGETRSYLLKFTILAPSLVFLGLSDYFESRFDCRPKKKPAFVVNYFFTATTMILVVFSFLYTLSNLYKIWLRSHRKESVKILKSQKFKTALKECLDMASTSKGIDKFKRFALDYKDLGTLHLEIRNLVWVYSLVHLRRDIRPADLVKNSGLLCSVCSQRFTGFQRVIPVEKDKELMLCHQECLLAQLFTDPAMFMPLDRLSSLLDKVVSNKEAKFDLSLLQTI